MSSSRFFFRPPARDLTERQRTILEALAAESVNTVTTALYDVCLNGKYVRDEEGIEILRMLYGSDARFEIAHIYNWGGIENTITGALTGNAGSFISSMQKMEKVMTKSMTKTMDAISE